MKKALFILLIYFMSVFETGLMARDISMVTVDWEPYYGSNLKNQGVMTVIVKEAFKRGGHNATVEFIPWLRALHIVKKGNANLVMGAYYSEKREKDYYYSDPFYELDVGFVALKSRGISEFYSLKDLKDYRIGISRGWVNNKEFDRAKFLNKRPADSPKLNIKKLFSKRVDLIVIAFGLFNYEINNLEKSMIQEYVYIQPPLQKHALHLIMSRKVIDYREVIDDFNRGLLDMKLDGTYEKILKEYGFKN
jgi:polar amino acid transport system substrate-binding protein